MGARELTGARCGDWHGSYGLVAGPGHGPKDRSLKVSDYNGDIRVHSFAGDCWKECRAHLGLDDDWQPTPQSAPRRRAAPSPSKPSSRCRDLIRTAAPVDLVPDAVTYLRSRALWPLPKCCPLKAHAGADYWDQGAEHPSRVGKFPALIAPVVDIDGESVTVHTTYLQDGRKLQGRTCRKLLSGTQGREGCAVRLVPLDGLVLAVGEGIETCLAAHKILGVPVWAALNTSLLAKFVPPPGVERLVIAADNDAAGLAAAHKLRDATTIPVEVRIPLLGDFAEDIVS